MISRGAENQPEHEAGTEKYESQGTNLPGNLSSLTPHTCDGHSCCLAHPGQKGDPHILVTPRQAEAPFPHQLP